MTTSTCSSTRPNGWAIEQAGALDIGKDALQNILAGDRAQAIRASLAALPASSKATQAWDALRALPRPPLSEVAQWALKELPPRAEGSPEAGVSG